jgi:hypothetical protein
LLLLLLLDVGRHGEMEEAEEEEKDRITFSLQTSFFPLGTMLVLRSAFRSLAHARPAAFYTRAAFTTSSAIRSEHHQPIIQGEGAKPGEVPTGQPQARLLILCVHLFSEHRRAQT